MPQFRPSEFPIGNSLALQNPAVPGISNVLVGTGVKGDKGDKGDTGESVYQVAVDNGFVGSEQEWLDYIRQNLYVQFSTSRHFGNNISDSFSAPGTLNAGDSVSSVSVAVNGVLQEPLVDFNLDIPGNKIVFTTPPVLGDKVVITRPIFFSNVSEINIVISDVEDLQNALDSKADLGFTVAMALAL